MGVAVEGSGDAPPTPTEFAEAAPGSDHPSDVPQDLNRPPENIFPPTWAYFWNRKKIQWTTAERQRERNNGKQNIKNISERFILSTFECT